MSTEKKCFVPACVNSNINAPEKKFVIVPFAKSRRKAWCDVVGVPVTASHRLYCCEDHFKFEEDAENWMYYITIGDQLKLKNNVVPHLNLHGENTVAPQLHQITSSAKKRKMEVKKMLSETHKHFSRQLVFDSEPSISFLTLLPMQPDVGLELLPSEKIMQMVDASVQVCVAAKSVLTQTELSPSCVSKNSDFVPTKSIAKGSSDSGMPHASRMEWKVERETEICDIITEENIKTEEETKAYGVKVEKEISKSGQDIGVCDINFEDNYKDEFEESDFLIENNCKTEEIEVHEINLDSIIKVKQETKGCNDIMKDNLEPETSEKGNPKVLFSEKPSNQCNLCGKLFDHKYKVTRHLKIHLDEKPHKCNVCGKSFIKRSVLIGHLKVHAGEKPYKCKLCSKSFTDDSNLRRHSKTHSGEKPHQCNFCGKSFYHKSYLTQHYLSVHSDEKPFKCKLCSKSFAKSSSLTYHLMIHSGEKPHECFLCGKSFRQGVQLKQHLRIHTGEKPYTCDLCDRSFSCSSNLKSHTNSVHSKSRFKCDLCDKSFSCSANLKSHTNSIHSGQQKSYKCKLCSKSFCHTYNFVRHLRIHTGEK